MAFELCATWAGLWPIFPTFRGSAPHSSKAFAPSLGREKCRHIGSEGNFESFTTQGESRNLSRAALALATNIMSAQGESGNHLRLFEAIL